MVGAAGPSLLPLHTPDIQPSGANLHQAAPGATVHFSAAYYGPSTTPGQRQGSLLKDED